MHPDDVAEHVVAEVAELERRLQATPELGVTRVALENDTDLYLDFHKEERPRIEATLPSAMLGPGGQPVSVRYAAVDLGRKTERELILYMESTTSTASRRPPSCCRPTARLSRPPTGPTT